jgi:hypothetical protein
MGYEILFEISVEFRKRIAGKIIHLWSQQESELKINSVIFRAPKRENKFTCMRLALAGASSICFSRSGNYGLMVYIYCFPVNLDRWNASVYLKIITRHGDENDLSCYFAKK